MALNSFVVSSRASGHTLLIKCDTKFFVKVLDFSAVEKSPYKSRNFNEVKRRLKA